MKKEKDEENLNINKMKIGEENVVCSGCGGVGSVVKSPSYYRRATQRETCPRCKGKGKIDWVTSIMKRENT
jgi:DnaJ-class molecular chaperone